ncbi:MAG: glycosyltransferase family 2 protein, partial [Bacilli bacterium]
MKIIALMIVKNEDDVVGHSLDSARIWADKIIIMNNNSSDNTEEIIKKKIAEYDNIVYWGRYDGVFRDGLRALLYLDNKDCFEVGDWIVRLDADEFFIDNPREFLSNTPDLVNFVKSASFQYYYTEKDHQQEMMDENYLLVPPHKRLKYYSCNWSEYRCVKVTRDFK